MTDSTRTAPESAAPDGGATGRSERLPLRMRIAMGIGRPTCRFLMKLLYRVRVDGEQRIPKRGPVIIIANHQSYLDPILVGLLATRREFRAIARSGLFKFRFFARLIELYGAIPIQQGKGDLAAFRMAIDEINKGRALVIYPEGGRTRDGTTQPFARGFHLVLKRTSACVVPVFIEGAYDAWPASRRFPRLFGRIAVRAAEPIPHDQLIEAPAGEVLESLRRFIEQGRMRLRHELRDESNGRFPTEQDGDTPYWDRGGQSSSEEMTTSDGASGSS